MPQQGKARRAAARQTQLGQRKKRQHREPGEVPAAFPSTEPLDSSSTTVSLDEGSSPGAAPSQPMAAPHPAPSRRPEPRPAVYGYVEAEIKRVAILAGGIFAILIVLTFLLR